MGQVKEKRLLVERPLPRDGQDRVRRRKAVRTVKVNLAESPLGWLLARGMITVSQYDAGERLRLDWEQAQLSPAVTMRVIALVNAGLPPSAGSFGASTPAYVRTPVRSPNASMNGASRSFSVS